ncbi:subtilase family-domain-containing protein [Blastocladiella britannica]|nr:subtilase family-domain-containing protein [Blastocladiella britannica]
MQGPGTVPTLRFAVGRMVAQHQQRRAVACNFAPSTACTAFPPVSRSPFSVRMSEYLQRGSVASHPRPLFLFAKHFFSTHSTMKLDAFPTHGLLPKDDTEATTFIRKNPEYDGRGTVIAILDTGVDPTAPGMQLTTDGKPKIIDIVDCTGGGDVAMAKSVEATPHTPTGSETAVPSITGATSKRLLLSSGWANPTNAWRVGLLRGYSLFGPVLNRVKAERKQVRDGRAAKFEAAAAAELAAASTADERKDAQDKIDALKQLGEAEDAGPIYDVVCWHDGTHWRVAIDTDESGDLREQPALASYRFEGAHHRFGAVDNLAFSVNVYDQGDIVSVVTLAGSHGTHVAAIAAACHPDAPELNGIAPGAQIVSLRIGDTRLGSMETGAGLSRAILAMVENKCDVANMSYGEMAHVADAGRFIELLREQVVRKHGIIFVSSAGNEGPALTTVGAPGGTTAGVISVGAHVGKNQMLAEYALVNNTVEPRQYTWSSRGPTYDGDYGVDVYAPGSAITSVPTYQLSPYQLMNGTSMSSPNACGNISLLISGWKKEVPGKRLTAYRTLKALQATGIPVETDEFRRPFIQTDRAFTHLMTHKESVDQDVHYRVSIGDTKQRGVYLRSARETHAAYAATVSIKPEFPISPGTNAAATAYFVDLPVKGSNIPGSPVVSEADRDADNAAKLALDLRLTLVASAPWIRVPTFMHLTADGRGFPIEVDAHLLDAGLHVGHVYAYDSTADATKGYLFSVPVTIAKPIAPEEQQGGVVRFNGVKTSAGSIERKFIAVPTGASFADITMRARPTQKGLANAAGSTTPAIYLLRTLQLVPGRRYREFGQTYRYTLRPTAEGEGSSGTDVIGETKRARVVPGVTMEVTLAQWWSSSSTHELDIDVVFHGIAVQPFAHSTQGLVQGDGIARLELVSHVRREDDVTVTAAVEALRKFVRPTSVVISPLSATRDVTPDTRQVYQIVQSYPVKLTDAASVTPSLVGLSDVLYDAPYDAYLVHIHDAAGRLVVQHDMYPKAVKLDKGEYLVRVQIRHESVGVLEKLKDWPLALDFPAPSGASVDFYPTFADAVKKGTKLGKVAVLARGDRRAIFATLPADIKDAKPGDVVLVDIKVSEGGLAADKLVGGHAKLTLAVTNGAVASKKPESASKASAAKPVVVETLEDKIRDVKIAHLKSLKGKDDEATADARAALLTELTDAYPTYLPLLEVALDLAAPGEPSLHAATAVLAAIDRKSLAGDLALAAQDPAVSAADKKAVDARKATLVAALFKRASVLVETADHGAHNDETKAAVAEWKQWALSAADNKPDAVPAASSIEALALLVAAEAENGHSGAAVKIVNKYISATPVTKDNLDAIKKALVMRRDLVDRLGWDLYVENEDKAALLRWPVGGADAVPF